MPLYEFHCHDCERDSELLVRTIRWEGTRCPHCGSTKLEKKLSLFAASSTESAAEPVCTGTPGSCGLCGTGRAHSH